MTEQITPGDFQRLADLASLELPAEEAEYLRKELNNQMLSIEVLESIPIELRVINAYSKGGIPLKVDAIANIKVDSTEPALGNAVERLLDKTPKEMHLIAKDTLEGNLRGVLATLTPEEVVRIEDQPTQNLEALQEHMKGQQLLALRTG